MTASRWQLLAPEAMEEQEGTEARAKAAVSIRDIWRYRSISGMGIPSCVLIIRPIRRDSDDAPVV